MNEQKEKIIQYFNIIERHVLWPIENTDLSKSCYATLMLLFSVVDGLGMLLHQKRNVGVRERFTYFLEDYLGGDYKKAKDQIWFLRNSLIHNGINNISYMSATFKGEEEHLKSSSNKEKIFISSSKFTQDIKNAVEKLKEEILKDESILKERADRLEWKTDDPSTYWDSFSTSPGPIRFILQKNKNS